MNGPNTTRAFTRVGVGLTAELDVDELDPVSGRIHDISLSGISVESTASLPVGAPCRIRIRLETGTRPLEVRARGVVLRVASGHIAARITTLDADGFEHLQKLVLYNSRNAREIEQEIEVHADEHPTVAPLH